METIIRRALVALAVLAGASSAQAAITLVNPSSIDGANIRFGSGYTTGTSVFANTETGQQIVFTAGGALLRADGPHANIEGALDAATHDPNDTLPMNRLEIFLTDGGTFDNVELSLFGTHARTVSFSLVDNAGDILQFGDLALRTGENRFGFAGTQGQSVRRLAFTIQGGGIDGVRRIRMDSQRPGPVPEPSTWAMLLVGFGAIGYSLKTRRPSRKLQAV